MDCAHSESLLLTAKILIAGGFGVGKTTFVGAVSDVEALSTEGLITQASVGTDELTRTEDKTTTTLAFDFGRITWNNLRIFLFGTPGQERFSFMWDELVKGALGAVVLADTRRLQECFGALDYFEGADIPILVAVNEFDIADYCYTEDEVRTALELDPDVPVMMCDARSRSSVRNVLIRLTEHAIARATPARTSSSHLT